MVQQYRTMVYSVFVRQVLLLRTESLVVNHVITSQIVVGTRMTNRRVGPTSHSYSYIALHGVTFRCIFRGKLFVRSTGAADVSLSVAKIRSDEEPLFRSNSLNCSGDACTISLLL